MPWYQYWYRLPSWRFQRFHFGYFGSVSGPMMSSQSGLQTPVVGTTAILVLPYQQSNIFATSYIRLYIGACPLCVFVDTSHFFNLRCSVCFLYSTPRRPCTTSSASTGSSLIGSMQSPKYYSLKREVSLCTHVYSVVLVTILHLTFKSVFRLLTRLILKVSCSSSCENRSAFFKLKCFFFLFFWLLLLFNSTALWNGNQLTRTAIEVWILMS